jgi:hypothetical protein
VSYEADRLLIRKGQPADDNFEAGKSLLAKLRINRMRTMKRTLKALQSLTAAALVVGMLVATPAWAENFFFAAGAPDGKLGALSRRPSPGKLETETADDFVLAETTVITRATITGLIPLGSPLENIKDVEIELYHVFPLDSVFPPSGNVPSRANSPGDVEIDTATRAGASGTLKFSATVQNANFAVANTVVNGINKLPNVVTTHGEGAAMGEEVELTITFTNPIVLPPGDYFFRPEVLLTNGDFLYLSAPRPFLRESRSWGIARPGSAIRTWRRIGCGSAPTSLAAPPHSI